jgi:hypothetical protein
MKRLKPPMYPEKTIYRLPEQRLVIVDRQRGIEMRPPRRSISSAAPSWPSVRDKRNEALLRSKGFASAEVSRYHATTFRSQKPLGTFTQAERQFWVASTVRDASADDRYLRIPVGWSRRKPAVADRDLGRLNWADSAPTAVASGRTGVRAKAVIPSQGRRDLDEVRKAGLYDQIWQAFAVLLQVHTVGVMGEGRTYDSVCALRSDLGRPAGVACRRSFKDCRHAAEPAPRTGATAGRFRLHHSTATLPKWTPLAW